MFRFMVKNAFILGRKKKKKKTGGLLNFKYSVSPIRYEDLLHICNCTEKTIYLREVCVSFTNRVRYKELIGRLDIRELKTH